jgi:hypothetical protein
VSGLFFIHSLLLNLISNKKIMLSIYDLINIAFHIPTYKNTILFSLCCKKLYDVIHDDMFWNEKAKIIYRYHKLSEINPHIKNKYRFLETNIFIREIYLYTTDSYYLTWKLSYDNNIPFDIINEAMIYAIEDNKIQNENHKFINAYFLIERELTNPMSAYKILYTYVRNMLFYKNVVIKYGSLFWFKKDRKELKINLCDYDMNLFNVIEDKQLLINTIKSFRMDKNTMKLMELENIKLL